MPIRVLPPEVAARIAAGEVIERPASIVKELLENSLDAGASRIAIEVLGGGLQSIRVSDDGCGVDPEEIEAAFQRHATSKLEDDADLESVMTLGFRGEALPSIAAVAEVEMISRPPGSEAAAYIRLTPGAPPEAGTHGAPVGTTIMVRNLFARLPARRKFLRAPGSETNAVTAVVSHYALAYPEVRLTLKLDGRQALQTSGSGTSATPWPRYTARRWRRRCSRSAVWATEQRARELASSAWLVRRSCRGLVVDTSVCS